MGFAVQMMKSTETNDRKILWRKYQMRNFKKIAASVVALATIMSTNLSMAASATAVDSETIQSEAFIGEYSDADDRATAQFCLNNGLTISETKDFMDSYISIKNEKSALQTSSKRKLKAVKKGSTNTNDRINTYKNYYSGINASKNQHNAIVIVNNASGTYSTGLTLAYVPEWINVNDPFQYSTLNGYKNFQAINEDNAIYINGFVRAATTEEVPRGIMQFPFNVTVPNTPNHETHTEATIYSKFIFSRFFNQVVKGPDSIFDYETYVRGDVNHDGLVNDVDRDYLIAYNIYDGKIPAFHYTDQSDEIADIITPLAMDADGNGEIGLADAVCIAKSKD